MKNRLRTYEDKYKQQIYAQTQTQIPTTLLGHRTVAVLQIKWRTLTASMVSLMISLHWVAIEIYRCMWDEGMMCLRISEQKK